MLRNAIVVLAIVLVLGSSGLSTSAFARGGGYGDGGGGGGDGFRGDHFGGGFSGTRGDGYGGYGMLFQEQGINLVVVDAPSAKVNRPAALRSVAVPDKQKANS